MSESRLQPFVDALTAHGFPPDRIAIASDGSENAYFLFENESDDQGYIVVNAEADGVSVLDFHPTRGIDAEDIVDVDHCIQVVAKYVATRRKSLN